MTVFRFSRKRITLDDALVVEVAHRYAIRILDGDREFSIGFENACEPNLDRLIHQSTIQCVNKGKGENLVDAVEQVRLLNAVIKFCDKNKLTYRVVE
jgi:hypothetical protein